MNTLGEFALIQEVFLLLESENQQPIELAVRVDLREFDFTVAEINKLRRLAQRLELSLLTECLRHSPTASVVVEVRGGQRDETSQTSSQQ